MKEELQGKLVEILTSIQTAAGKASDFAMEQLPDVAQSYVVYGRASLTLYCLLGLALIVYAVWAARRATYHSRMFWKTNGDEERDHLNKETGYGITAIISGIVGLASFAFSVNGALLVWFAPKVWLLKEIAALVK